MYDEAEDQLIAALNAWDYRTVFSGGVEVMSDWPYDRLSDINGEIQDGAMVKPIISVVAAHSMDTFRGIGGQMSTSGALPAPGATRHATRVGMAFVVGCWADQRLGGYDTVKRLAGQAQGCIFYNQNRLAAYRHLRMKTSDPAFEDRPALWTFHLTVEGDAVVSYDA
jgi:hypothetical protein